MKRKVFDARRYELKQIVEALTCPINRYATMREHNCDEWFLYKKPELLIRHFIENGGAKAFAKRREEFMREIEVPDEMSNSA